MNTPRLYTVTRRGITIRCYMTPDRAAVHTLAGRVVEPVIA